MIYMEQPSYAPFQPNPMTSIISPHFCAPYPVDLAVVGNDGDFKVTDINGNILFKVKGSFFTIRSRRVLLDAAGNTIVTLRQKVFTAHNRWKVFRGNSTDAKDFIFSAKLSSLIQLKSKLNVFLAHNTSEKVCDFKVKGSWSERSCTIYAGESSTIVAQMHKKYTAKNILLGKDKYMVTVYPNMDYAFIVALIVILDEINTPSQVDSSVN